MLPALVLAAAMLLLPASGVQQGTPARFRVVAHAAVPASPLARSEISAIFMLRTRAWRDGSPIVPVDQPARAAARERFSEAVHGKSVAYVTRYWHRVIFSGRGIPPRELPNDAAVLDFVRRTPGAIGYVDAATPLPAGVKEIAVTP
jgi:hypothetical protein